MRQRGGNARKRKWGATGVVWDVEEQTLSDGLKEHLQIIVKEYFQKESKKQGMKTPNFEPFFEQLAEAVTRFNSHKILKESSRPGTVRQNLKWAHDAAIQLNNRLEKFDGNSCLLLNHTAEGGFEAFFRDVQNKVMELSEARRLANEYPKRGNLPDNESLCLALDVADAIQKYIGAKPTTTRGGLFQNLLSEVLAEATGKQDLNAYSLVEKALPFWKKRENPDGTLR